MGNMNIVDEILEEVRENENENENDDIEYEAPFGDICGSDLDECECECECERETNCECECECEDDGPRRERDVLDDLINMDICEFPGF